MLLQCGATPYTTVATQVCDGDVPLLPLQSGCEERIQTEDLKAMDLLYPQ